MANLKNWLPNMSPSEMAWFDKCPKAVLFEIARQFAFQVSDCDFDVAFQRMRHEWATLNIQGIVPQKPPVADRIKPA